MFGTFTSPTIIHNLPHPGENTKLLIVLSELLNSTSTILEITPVILLSPWCVAVSRSPQSEVTVPTEY